MSGTVLVTGGTRGLGYATVAALLRAESDGHIVIAARDTELGEGVAAQLGGQIEVLECDLADLGSVRRAAATLGQLLDEGTLPPLCGLVANAAVQTLNATTRTRDGFEQTFGINVLGHYLLVRLALDRMRAPARIILVSSGTHWGRLRHTGGIVSGPRWDHVDILARPRSGPEAATRRAGTTAYTTSKLALVYLAHELARRVPDGVDVYSYNPGLMPGTGLAREAGPLSRLVWRTVAHVVRVLPGATGVRASGAELAAALVGPKPAESGSYLDRGRPTRSSPDSYDPERERDLWSTAARLVGLVDRPGE